ncbi:MAG: hypothetical protein QF570_01280 [Myxococcota bacterium]|nr:hypothetical protein [Myxococcota bacterium]
MRQFAQVLRFSARMLAFGRRLQLTAWPPDDTPRDAERNPIPETDPAINGGDPVGCLLNLSCTLQGITTDDGDPTVCLVNGQCADDDAHASSSHGDPCTNVTYRDDCGVTAGGDTIACNVERNLELNGAPRSRCSSRTIHRTSTRCRRSNRGSSSTTSSCRRAPSSIPTTS